MNEKIKVDKENAREILNIVEEWVNNPDAELYFEGNLVTWSPSFDSNPRLYEVRYPKKTIVVNGVEVPAPEKKALVRGSRYFVTDPTDTEYHCESFWYEDEEDYFRLANGLVYLKEEDAIARAKAMLIYKEK